MNAIIKTRQRCFQANKLTVVQFIQGAISRSDAVPYLNKKFQDGSLKHWQDLLYALLMDITDIALLSFDEAAFIGRELALTSPEVLTVNGEPVQISEPPKRKPGRPFKVVS